MAGDCDAAVDRRRAVAQVFVDELDEGPGNLELEDDDAHHLDRVLRLRAGELVVVADGRGMWRWCRFRPSAGARSVLEPVAPAQREPQQHPAITVAFAPLKGDRPEWTVQKLTELGVDRIVVLDCDRAVVRWRDGREARAIGRLRKVAREAAGQSRRVWLPRVEGPSSMAQLCASDPSVALADPDGGAPSLDRPVLAVGPEGGWSDDERARGLPTVALGPQILRAETAAVAAGVLLSALRAGTVEPRRPDGMPRHQLGEGEVQEARSLGRGPDEQR